MADPALQAYAQQQGIANGVPWNVFNAQITQESSWDPTAVSKSGCVGIAQICDPVSFDKTDPYASLNYMAQRMGNAFKKYGSWGTALASYNAGDGAVARFGGVPPPNYSGGETYNYVNTILKNAGSPQSGAGNLVSAGSGSPVAQSSTAPASGNALADVAHYFTGSDWSTNTKRIVFIVVALGIALVAAGPLAAGGTVTLPTGPRRAAA